MARRSPAAEAPAPRKRAAPRKRPVAAAAEAASLPSPLPFVPAALDVEAMHLWNVAYRLRRPWQVSLAGVPAHVVFAPRPVPVVSGVTVDLTIAGRPAAAWVPAAFAEEVLAALPQQFDPARLSPQHLAMLAEFATLPGLRALEDRLGAAIVLVSLQSQAPDETRGPWVDVRIIRNGREEVPARLLLPPETGEEIIAALGDGPPPGGHDELPCSVAVRIGATTLPVADVASLRVGDAVLVDCVAGADAAVAVVADCLAAPAVVGEAGIRLEDFPRPAAGSMLEWCMTTAAQNEGHGADAEDTALAMVPVHLVFELGRIDLPLAEVQRLAPGVTLPLAVPVAGEVDILGNGRRIGRGVMVRIGESIGVRIVRLAGHG
ncbi:type III secretion system apparatus protein YscQ/HrcQ [Chelatococcus sambhunathii]|uniref:Type III secretion system apparatus protein YscQ/HrcQ n=1 Tax=Chelatococcus sambhunathii TaxID=363953 RepID=A0ABM9U735_9HYPH|nr:type III secretion system cytoplasmic ring protein SctQ [Chelatococcus sambhunathii]CUA89398.1 type III secretion system apparatus protein YscQ/HrcQ [Chelatococcus sambhunathii]